jgi:hypothetical protein
MVHNFTEEDAGLCSSAHQMVNEEPFEWALVLPLTTSGPT